MAIYTYSAPRYDESWAPNYGVPITAPKTTTTAPTTTTTKPAYISGFVSSIGDKTTGDVRPTYGPTNWSPIVGYTWGTAGVPDPDLTGGLSGTTGGGGGGGGGSSERDDAAAGARASLDYLNRLIRANRAQYGSLSGNLEAAFAPRRQDVQSQYAAALAALQGRRTEAETLASQGQAALGEYLARNLPRAYGGLPQATGPQLSPDVVSTYAQAIGAPTGQIGEAAVRAATEAAGNVDAYNRLLSNLQSMESNTQNSRLAELEMLRNVQNAGIQQLYGGGATALEQQRLAALNALVAEQAQQRYIIDQQRIAREQAIQQALAQVYGTGYVPFNPADFFSTSGPF